MKKTIIDNLNIMRSLLILMSMITLAPAGGISVDAGLTPAQNRWMVRYQVRHIKRSHENMNPESVMQTDMHMLNLAYGLRADLTIMIMQSWMDRESDMMNMQSEFSGMGDLNLMAKYRLYRHNSSTNTLGLATTLCLTAPTGEDPFTSDYWSLAPGFYLSYRLNNWALDASTNYRFQDLLDEKPDGFRSGYEFSLSSALARQLVLGTDGRTALAPVLELTGSVSRNDQMPGQAEQNNEVLMLLSPGLKWTYSSLILEFLVQIPILQDLPEGSMEHSPRGLVGMRYMF